MKRTKNQLCGIFKPSFHKILISEEAILCEDRTTEDERRSEYYDACHNGVRAVRNLPNSQQTAPTPNPTVLLALDFLLEF